MPEALLLAPVAAEAATIDEIVVGSYVSSAGLTAASTSVFTSAAATFLGKAVLSIGASFALNYVANALRRTQPLPGTAYTIKAAAPARFIDVGRVKTGGALFVYESPDNYLYVGKVLTCTPIAAIEQIWFNDTLGGFSGPIDGSQQVPLNGLLNGLIIETRLGTLDQSVSLLLSESAISIGGGGFGGHGLGGGNTWPLDYRLAGLPWEVTRYVQPHDKSDFLTFYPNGAQETSAVISAALCPDPRDPDQDLDDPLTWQWRDNAACVILRFMLDIDGWGFSSDDIDVASFQTSADDCDEQVPTTTGLEPRYRIWGRYSTSTDRATTLRDMLAACDGRLLEGPDGRAKLFIGVSRIPTVSLSAADFFSLHVEPYGDPLDRAGVAQPRVILENYSWQEQAAPPVYLPGADPSAAAQIEDMGLPYCPSVYQSQRLGKIKLNQLSPQWTISGVGKLSALNSFGERYINFVFDELGISGIFEVAAFGISLQDFSYPMKLISVADGMYDMTALDLKDLPAPPLPPGGTTGDVAFQVPAPAGVTAVYTAHSPDAILVGWTDNGFSADVEYRVINGANGPDDNWTLMTVTPPNQAAAGTLPHASYEIRIRTVGTRSTSPWDGPIAVT